MGFSKSVLSEPVVGWYLVPEEEWARGGGGKRRDGSGCKEGRELEW